MRPCFLFKGEPLGLLDSPAISSSFFMGIDWSDVAQRSLTSLGFALMMKKASEMNTESTKQAAPNSIQCCKS